MQATLVVNSAVGNRMPPPYDGTFDTHSGEFQRYCLSIFELYPEAVKLRVEISFTELRDALLAVGVRSSAAHELAAYMMGGGEPNEG